LRAVFLDRDGVINKKLPQGRYVTKWEEFEFLEGAAAAIRLLNERGLLVFVLTNQRGIARGLLTKDALRNIHGLMLAALSQHGARIDCIYSCPHDVEACECRKPGVGLFLEAKREFPVVDFQESFVIGDSWTDIEAGAKLECKCILISGSVPLEEWPSQCPKCPTAPSLYQAVIDHIVRP